MGARTTPASMLRIACSIAAIATCVACGSAARLPLSAGIGPSPALPEPKRSLLPTIFVPFSAGKPSGAPIDVLTGFVKEDGNATGRPVGVAIDGQGALLVADDVGNVMWRVTAQEPRR